MQKPKFDLDKLKVTMTDFRDQGYRLSKKQKIDILEMLDKEGILEFLKVTPVVEYSLGAFVFKVEKVG